MAYIGRQNLGGAYRQLDDISSGFDGSDTTHTMQVNSQNVTVGDVNQIILSLGGVIQKPGTDFTVSGSVLTFTTAPAANTSFFAVLLGSDNGGTVTPTDRSETTTKLAQTISEIKNTGGDIDIDADGGGINFLDGGTQIGALENDSTDFIIKSNVSDRDIIFKGNDGGSGVTAWSMDMSAGGHLLPGNSATGIYLGVNSATAANLLDDYEYGTYDVTVTGSSSGSMSISAANVTQAYVKVGKLVHVQGYIGCSGDNSISGNIRFSLPFTNASGLADDADYFYGTVMLQNNGTDVGGITRGFSYDGAGAFCYIVSTTTAGITDYIQHNDTDDIFQIGYGFTYRTTA